MATPVAPEAPEATCNEQSGAAQDTDQLAFTTMSAADFPANAQSLIDQLRKRIESAKIEPLEDEPEFNTRSETLTRFLIAREWNLAEAEKQLTATINWRRSKRPLFQKCIYCHESPGIHSMRQIGFDIKHRPVIYSSFSQARCKKNTSADYIAHIVYTLENAKKSVKMQHVPFIFIIDCHGITLPCCNPKMAYEGAQVMANYYPEQVGHIFIINHSELFNSVWRAIKVFINPRTVSKVKLVRKPDIPTTFRQYFPDQLTDWLLEEIRLNNPKTSSELEQQNAGEATAKPKTSKKLCLSQRMFWMEPEKRKSDNLQSAENSESQESCNTQSGMSHDPRGCADYIGTYLKTDLIKSATGIYDYLPHPNIVDYMLDRLTRGEAKGLFEKKSKSDKKPKESSSLDPKNAVNTAENKSPKNKKKDCNEELIDEDEIDFIEIESFVPDELKKQKEQHESK